MTLFKNRIRRKDYLAQCTIYLVSPKSNSAYDAINKALEKVKEFGDLSIPLHLRNAPNSFERFRMVKTTNMTYKNKLHLQEFLPEKISGESFINLKEPKEKSVKM